MVDGRDVVSLGPGLVPCYGVWFPCPHDIQQHSVDGHQSEMIIVVAQHRIPSCHIPERTKVALEGDPHEVVPVPSAPVPLVCLSVVQIQV